MSLALTRWNRGWYLCIEFRIVWNKGISISVCCLFIGNNCYIDWESRLKSQDNQYWCYCFYPSYNWKLINWLIRNIKFSADGQSIINWYRQYFWTISIEIMDLYLSSIADWWEPGLLYLCLRLVLTVLASDYLIRGTRDKSCLLWTLRGGARPGNNCFVWWSISLNIYLSPHITHIATEQWTHINTDL